MRRTARRALLVLAAVAVALATAELALRVAAHVLHRERGVVAHPEFGWSYVPRIAKVGRYWGHDRPARTNARGWRDDPTPLARPPQGRRIVALGDSFTFGVPVDDGERFTECLERDFAGLEVVNLGMNAIGPDQELRILEVEGVRYRPDLVLLTTFLGNDLDDIRYVRKNSYPKPWYDLVDGELRLHRPEPSWDVLVRSTSYLGELVLRPFDRTLLTSKLAEPWRTADTLPLYRALLRRMRAVAATVGADFSVVVVHPTESHGVGRTERARRVLAALAEDGMSVIDTYDAITACAATGETPFGPGGDHWSPRGHRVVADLIDAALGARGWTRGR